MANYQREVNFLIDFILWQFIFSLNNDGRRECVAGFAFCVLGLGTEDADYTDYTDKANADQRFPQTSASKKK